VSPRLAALHPRRAWPRLRRSGAWGALGQIALAGSGFLVSAAVARSGGPAALGLFTLVQGGTLLMTGLLKAALGDPLVIDAHGGRRLDGLAVVPPVLCGHLGLGLLAALAWLLAGGRLHGLPAPTGAELVLAVLLPLASFQELARSVRLAGTGERRLCTGDVLVAFARVATLAACAQQLPGAELGMAALAAGGLASVLTVWRQLRLPAGLAQVTRLWRLGRWLAGENLLYGVSNYGVWLLLVSRAGPGVVGGLRAGQQLFTPVQTALIGLNTVMLGRFARLREGQARAGLLLGSLEVGVTGAWGALLVALGPRATSAIFGPAFQLPRRDLAVLTAALMVTTAFELAALRLRAARQVRSLVVARAASSAVVLAGTALTGTSVMGVAASLLGGSLLGGSLVGARLLRGGHRRPLRATVPLRREVAGCEGREQFQGAD
jgi:O-antigen/teichoic acid export membrane protein